MATRATRIGITYVVTYADAGTKEMLAGDRKMRTSVAQTNKLLADQSATVGKLASEQSRAATKATRVAVAQGDQAKAAQRASGSEKALADSTAQAAATAAKAARAAAEAATAYARQAAGAQKGAQGTAELTAATRRQAAASAAVVAPVKAAARAHTEVAAAAAATGRSLNQSGTAMVSHGRKAKQAGSAMSGLAMPMALVGVVSGKMAMDFGRAMEQLHGQAGASEAEVRKLSKAVLDLAPSVGKTPLELAGALYQVESAGLRGAKALDVVKSAAIGARIGNANLADVTGVLVGIMRTAPKDVGSTADAMGKLNTIVGQGRMHMTDLVGALSTGILPAAKSAGAGLASVGAALDVMTNRSVPAEAAATRLRMTFALMSAPTAKAQKELATIGLNQYDLAKALRGPGGLPAAVMLLKHHLEASGKSAVEQNAVISRAFGGGRSSSAIMMLVQNAGELNKAYKKVGQDGTKSLEEANARFEKTSAGHWERIRAQFAVTGVKLGQALLPLLPVFATLGSVIGTVAGVFDKLPGPVKDTAVATIALGIAMSPLLKAYGNFAIVGGGAIKMLGGLRKALFGAAEGEVALNAASAGGILGGGKSALGKAAGRGGMAADLVALGGAPARGGLLSRFGGLGRLGAGAGRIAAPVALLAGGLFGGQALGQQLGIGKGLGGVAGGALGGAGAGAMVGGPLGALVGAGGGAVIGALMMKSVRHALADVAKFVWNWNKGWPKRIWEGVKAAGDFFAKLPGLALRGLRALPGVMGTAFGFLVTLPLRFARFGFEAGVKLVQAIGRALPKLAGIAGHVVGFIVTLPIRLATLGFKAGRFLVEKLWDGLKAAVKLVPKVIAFFVHLPGRIGSFGLHAGGQFFSKLWGAIKAVAGLVPRVVNFFVHLPGKIGHIAVSAAGKFIGGLGDMVKKAPGLVASVVGKFVSLVGDFWKVGIHAAERFAGGLLDQIKKVIPGPIKDLLGLSGGGGVHIDYGKYKGFATHSAPGSVQTVRGGHAQAAGGVVYAAAGQLMQFTPRGTDTVPAMLTPGEFVVRRPAVQKLGVGAMHQINAGNLPGLGGTHTVAVKVAIDTRSAQQSTKQLGQITTRTGRDLGDKLGRPAKSVSTDVTKQFRKLRDDSGKSLTDVPKIAKKQIDLTHDQTVNRLRDTQRDGMRHITKLHDDLDATMKDAVKKSSREADHLHDNVQSSVKSMAKVVAAQTDRARSSSNSNFKSMQSSASSRTGKARADVTTNYGSMAKTAQSRGAAIENTTRAHMTGAAGHVRTRSRQMQTTLRSSLGSMDSTSREGFTYIGTAADKALSSFGAKPVHLSLQAPKLKATGGWIDGTGLYDTVPAWLAPGEFVANRHHQPVLNHAMDVAYMMGEVPYRSLGQLADNITTPHYMATGGFVPRFAKGGQVGNFGAMVAKANEISSHNYPYLWGGGHNGSFSPPYDCSGGVSAVLHAGGVLNSPLVASSFMNWGSPGPGKVTIHAGPGHVMMELGGRGWGTSHVRPGGGAGWLPFGNTPITPATRHIGASGSANIKMPKVLGPKGSLHEVAYGSIKKVHDAAQKYVDSKMPTGSVGGAANFGKGAWQDELRAFAKSRGWSADDWFWIVQHESGGIPGNTNPSSGATGLGQMLGGNIAKYNGRGTATQQIDGMGQYIADRYGNPTAAKSFWLGHNWYARGGKVGRNASPRWRPGRGGGSIRGGGGARWGAWRPRKMAAGGYVSGGAMGPLSSRTFGTGLAGTRPDFDWRTVLGHLGNPAVGIPAGAPMDYARFMDELLRSMTKFSHGKPQYRGYYSMAPVTQMQGQGGMATMQGGSIDSDQGRTMVKKWNPPTAATEKLVRRKIIEAIRKQVERYTNKELAFALRDTQAELDLLTTRAQYTLKTIHTAIGDVRTVVDTTGTSRQLRTNVRQVNRVFHALETDANKRVSNVFDAISKVVPAGATVPPGHREARAWKNINEQNVSALMGALTGLGEFVDWHALTQLQGLMTKPGTGILDSAKKAAANTARHLTAVEKREREIKTSTKDVLIDGHWGRSLKSIDEFLTTKRASLDSLRQRKRPKALQDQVAREIGQAVSWRKKLTNVLYGAEGSGGIEAQIRTLKHDPKLKAVAKVEGWVKTINDAIGAALQGAFDDTSSEIDGLANDIDDAMRKRRMRAFGRQGGASIDFATGLGTGGAPMLSFGDLATTASASFATDSVAALQDTIDVQKASLDAMGGYDPKAKTGTGYMKDLYDELKHATNQHQYSVAKQIRDKIGELAATISETAASMIENVRAAAEKAAQDKVDLAQWGVTGYMTPTGQVTGQAGLTHLELQQRLAGTYDTGGAERSAYITGTIVPALTAELAALKDSLTVAEQEGDPALARQIATEIATVTNDRDQAKIDALEQIAQNTQALQQFSGSLAFNFNNESYVDMANIGVGA